MNNAKFAPHPTCFSSNLKSCRKKKKKTVQFEVQKRELTHDLICTMFDQGKASVIKFPPMKRSKHFEIDQSDSGEIMIVAQFALQTCVNGHIVEIRWDVYSIVIDDLSPWHLNRFECSDATIHSPIHPSGKRIKNSLLSSVFSLHHFPNQQYSPQLFMKI